MDKFPFEHLVKEDTKEVWILCRNSINTIAISALIKKYYPGYIGYVASESYFEKLKGQL
jgi:hypothetical protein